MSTLHQTRGVLSFGFIMLVIHMQVCRPFSLEQVHRVVILALYLNFCCGKIMVIYFNFIPYFCDYCQPGIAASTLFIQSTFRWKICPLVTRTLESLTPGLSHNPCVHVLLSAKCCPDMQNYSRLWAHWRFWGSPMLIRLPCTHGLSGIYI